MAVKQAAYKVRIFFDLSDICYRLHARLHVGKWNEKAKEKKRGIEG